MRVKTRITLDGKELKLWFNQYSDFEINKVFGTDKPLMESIQERVEQNELSFIADLIWIGVVGNREATMGDTPISRQEIRLHLADASQDEIRDVSKVFFEALGANLEKEDDPESEEKKS